MKKEDSRFEMTKKHHKTTFERAVEEGKADKEFIPLCKHVTKTKDYFTSSCCSGRIALMNIDEEEGKKENAFYRKWHRKVKDSEVIDAVKKFDGNYLWFKQDPLILHIGAKDLNGAKKIISISHKSGIKRAGIIVAKEGKFIVEILGAKDMNAPVKGKDFCADERYLKKIVRAANIKFSANQKSLKKLEKEIETGLK